MTASIASRGRGARPRFVWSTVPVRLKTRRSDGVACAAAVRVTRSTRLASSIASPLPAMSSRASAMTRRMTSVTIDLSVLMQDCLESRSRNRRSTDGKPLRELMKRILVRLPRGIVEVTCNLRMMSTRHDRPSAGCCSTAHADSAAAGSCTGRTRCGSAASRSRRCRTRGFGSGSGFG